MRQTMRGLGRRTYLGAVRGVSLVETMLALMVLVGGVAALRHAFPTHLATARQAAERIQATLLGQQHVERLRLRGFTALAPGQQATMPVTCVPSLAPEMGERFCVQEHIVHETDALLALHVRVTWPQPAATHEVRLATYVSRQTSP